MDRHEEDIEFIHKLKVASDEELQILLKFQACEKWKQIAILREQWRRESKE